jgi:hypothetical protein
MRILRIVQTPLAAKRMAGGGGLMLVGYTAGRSHVLYCDV